jgi:hypothetical protein
MDSVRRRCEARLRHVTLPDPFDLAELCQKVSARRGRPLHVRGIPGPATRTRPCRIWIATDDEDWIFVDQDTSPLPRQHIVVHELAHMLCGHDATGLQRRGDLRHTGTARTPVPGPGCAGRFGP